MIRVLQSFDEVGQAILRLQILGCPLHYEPQKNWDMAQILDILLEVKPNYLLDMGAGGLHVLRLFRYLGFKNCFGIDLNFSWRERINPYYFAIKHGTTRLPFKLIRGDLTKTSFYNSYFDVIICLSVIEHGVNIESFFKEASRLLRKNGTLYVSTDYCEPKIRVDRSIKPFGLEWNIFSKKEIENLINTAKKYNLFVKDEYIPSVKEKIVYWLGYYYTFISLLFNKKA